MEYSMMKKINLKIIITIKDEKINYFLTNYYQKIIEHFGPNELWFWGSRIYGDARPDSDIDVLIVSDVFSDIRLIKRRSTFLKTIGKLRDKNLPVVDAFCLTPKEFLNKKSEDGFFKDLLEKGIRVI